MTTAPTITRRTRLNGVQQFRLEKLVERVCERFGVSEAELRDAMPGSKVARVHAASQARNCIYMHARELLGLTCTQIALAMNHHHSTVARGIGLLRTSMRSDETLRAQVESMRLFAASLMEVERL